MRSVRDIIKEVQHEERAARDEDLERHHQANAKLQVLFDQLNDDEVSRTYGANADRGRNGVNIIVTRVGKTVCIITKDVTNFILNSSVLGDIKVEDQSISTARSECFHDPEDALKHVILLLESHKRRFPIVDRLAGYRSRDEEDAA